jgi:hypothetical protein
VAVVVPPTEGALRHAQQRGVAIGRGSPNEVYVQQQLPNKRGLSGGSVQQGGGKKEAVWPEVYREDVLRP